MKRLAINKHTQWPLLAGLAVGLIAMLVTVKLAMAAPTPQESQPTPQASSDQSLAGSDPQTCFQCHPNIADSWSNSPHAHAFEDPNFQDRWRGLGQPGNCLLCHTTNYQATSGTYSAQGVSCEACHGKVDPNHPPAAVPIRADTEYCGTCHTTTLGEWRLTGHATADVGCTDCHDPHSQKALFEDPDQMCINCHKDSMEAYLEDLHGQRGIGCVDCHALVIPPDTPPEDGIVPTGHTFTITPKTCIACHTDALHAGFSLPGYENGAKSAKGAITKEEEASLTNPHSATPQSPDEQIQLLTNQVQVLQASNASRGMTVLFQGGVVGLVLGGSTAWIVASNIRQARRKEEEEENDEGRE